jgi:hypothetical protein
MAESDTLPSGSPWSGVYFAILQLVFTLGWVVYVIYLPKLAAQVGLAPGAVILILMLDQAIFTIADTAMGAAADRVVTVVGRIGVWVGALAALSCAAFVALPFVAGSGPGAQPVLIGLIVLWAVTSSALRAPPLSLLGKYAARPKLPLLSGFAMLGYGLAGAAAPYLGVALREQDARLPFVLSGLVLLITALALGRVERLLRPSAPPPGPPPAALPVAFVAAILVLALGFQLHIGLNTSPLFLRFAAPADLEWLLPVFWIGFSLAMVPAGLLTKRFGGLIVIGAAGLLGALAVGAAEQAGSLNALIAAQLVAGAAWGTMLSSALAAALRLGASGAEGKLVGLVFSALALATFARMAAVAGGLTKLPDTAAVLQWAPTLCWAIGGAWLSILAATHLRRPAETATAN